LPSCQHFSTDNFIADALDNRKISINGDGMPILSYLYAADMVGWLWSILVQETTPSTVHNVDSDQGLSMLGLAKIISKTIGATQPVELKHDQQESGKLTK